MSLQVIILAAGKGSRMRSALPKVLQPLSGKPLLAHVVSAAEQLGNAAVTVVVGHEAEMVQSVMAKDFSLNYVAQTEQLGTGHAVRQANEVYGDDDVVLVLYGDVPLIQTATLNDLLGLVTDEHPLSVLTITLEDSSGYGRIIRDAHHQVSCIVEEKDASPEQKQVKEVNTGIMAVQGRYLRKWLGELSCQNAQEEYYLTDIISMCVAEGKGVATTEPSSEIEVLGVNDKRQLHGLERAYQLEKVEQLFEQGVTLLDSHRVDIRGELAVGQDVSIDINVVFEGKVTLGNNVSIGANCIIKDSVIADNTIIQPFSHIDSSQLAENCVIGPYARLRPGTNLSAKVKIGNFVETKKAQIGEGSKVSHLSYIGDTVMGANCNIGAGTITCNYDGVNKYQTTLGDKVFVGSASQLIAPVSIGDNATIGAGSTISKDAPEDTLTLSRAKQISLKGWEKPVKK